MEKIDNLKSTSVEKNKTYKVEHFPKLDVIVNLDYPKQEDCKELLGIIGKNQLDNVSHINIDKLLLKISSIKDGEDKKFFIKKKPETVKHKTKNLVDLIKNPKQEEVLGEFKDRKVRYGLAGVLGEIVLSNKIKKVINLDLVQKLAQKYNFSSMKFSEPIVSFLEKEDYKRFVIYKNLKEEDAKSFFDKNKSESLAENLREIFFKNGIIPNDLSGRQFVVTKENEKYHINLIDTEAYTNI